MPRLRRSSRWPCSSRDGGAAASPSCGLPRVLRSPPWLCYSVGQSPPRPALDSGRVCRSGVVGFFAGTGGGGGGLGIPSGHPFSVLLCGWGWASTTHRTPRTAARARGLERQVIAAERVGVPERMTCSATPSYVRRQLCGSADPGSDPPVPFAAQDETPAGHPGRPRSVRHLRPIPPTARRYHPGPGLTPSRLVARFQDSVSTSAHPGSTFSYRVTSICPCTASSRRPHQHSQARARVRDVIVDVERSLLSSP